MKLKNREGSTLLLTLMIFAVLMIFATFTLGFMVTENKQSMYHQHKTQAYYVARSGAETVEAAILSMTEEGSEEELSKLESKLPIDNIQIEGLSEGDSRLRVSLKKEDDSLIITSTAHVNGVEESIEKVLVGESIKQSIKIEHALFSDENITMSGSATITSDISTNKSIIINGSPNIRNVFLQEGQSISAPDWWLSSWKKNYSEHRLDSPIEYPNFDFKPFPSVIENKSSTNFILNGNGTKTIYESTDYNILKIDSNTKFYIDTTAGDVVLNIEKLYLSQGHIILIGNNKVKMNIGDFIMGGSSTINSSGSKENLIIHQYGNKKVDIGGSQKVKGDFYIEEADLKIAGSASIEGDVFTRSNNISLSGAQSIVGSLFIEKGSLTISGSGRVHGSILTNGNRVNLSGSAIMAKGVLYAPNADVVLSGSGGVVGAVVSKSATLSGAGEIEFNPSYVVGTPIPTSSYSQVVYKKMGYYR